MRLTALGVFKCRSRKIFMLVSGQEDRAIVAKGEFKAPRLISRKEVVSSKEY